MKNRNGLLGLAGVILLAGVSFSASADRSVEYEVRITNLTKAISFTPQLVVSHHKSASLFNLGEPASEAVEALAEGGDTTLLTDDINNAGIAKDVKTIPGLLGPGQMVMTTLTANFRKSAFSMMSMLLPTNDTFVAVDSVALPFRGSKTIYAIAYDAGTEENDQNCLNIPGPLCGGEAISTGDYPADEGFIYVSNGFHDLGTEDEAGNRILQPKNYDWKNPVAKIEITRIR